MRECMICHEQIPMDDQLYIEEDESHPMFSMCCCYRCSELTLLIGSDTLKRIVEGGKLC